MKKVILLAACCMLLHYNVNAQKGKSTVCLNAGYSIMGTIFSFAETRGGMDFAIQATYDYSVRKWFSVGIAGSYQKLNAGFENIQFQDYPPFSFNADFSRTNIAARVLFHYGPENIRMYSGLRLGTTLWKSEITVGEVPIGFDPMELLGIGGSFVPQLVLYGIRGYVTDHLGFNFEIGIGSPHLFSGGVCARF